MTRKMLKEEKELRKYLDQRLMEDEYQNAATQLTALVRAVRERYEKVVEVNQLTGQLFLSVSGLTLDQARTCALHIRAALDAKEGK